MSYFFSYSLYIIFTCDVFWDATSQFVSMAYIFCLYTATSPGIVLKCIISWMAVHLPSNPDPAVLVEHQQSQQTWLWSCFPASPELCRTQPRPGAQAISKPHRSALGTFASSRAAPGATASTNRFSIRPQGLISSAGAMLHLQGDRGSPAAQGSPVPAWEASGERSALLNPCGSGHGCTAVMQGVAWTPSGCRQGCLGGKNASPRLRLGNEHRPVRSIPIPV